MITTALYYLHVKQQVKMCTCILQVRSLLNTLYQKKVIRRTQVEAEDTQPGFYPSLQWGIFTGENTQITLWNYLLKECFNSQFYV